MGDIAHAEHKLHPGLVGGGERLGGADTQGPAVCPGSDCGSGISLSLFRSPSGEG